MAVAPSLLIILHTLAQCFLKCDLRWNNYDNLIVWERSARGYLPRCAGRDKRCIQVYNLLCWKEECIVKEIVML